MDTLRPLGFESYRLEDLTLDEEINLFSRAEVVVGAHGAGLATTIYSEDATVIELFPYNFTATCYFILANELGLAYDYLHGEPVDTPAGTNYKNADIEIAVDKLEEIVNKNMN